MNNLLENDCEKTSAFVEEIDLRACIYPNTIISVNKAMIFV